MGVFTRRIIKEDLDKVNVFLEDTKNEIFVVQDVPETFGQGRSTFKIFGSNFLKDNVPLKIEILDKSGETVYVQPVKYGSVNPKLPYRYVSVEVYREINIPGEAKLVILGELDPSVINVPQEFQGTYNVKFSKTINIDTFTFKNTQPILFYKKPTFTAQEIVSARKKVNPQENSEVTGSQIFGRVKDDLRGKRFLFGYDVNSQENTNEGGKSESSTGDIRAEVDTYKYKTGLFGKKAIISKRGIKEERASEEPPQMRIFSNATTGPFTSKMVGGTIDIKNIQLTDAQKSELANISQQELVALGIDASELGNFFSTDSETENLPNYSAKIERVVSSTELVTSKPYSVFYNEGGDSVRKIYSDIGTSTLNANFTASFIDWEVPATSSFHFDSFVDVDLKNLRTFSGDVYRVKVYGASDESTTDFPVLLDTVIESPELLRDTTSPSGFLRSGYFKDQTHINKYWNGFAGNNTTAQFTSSYDSSLLIDGVLLSGSYAEPSEVGRFELDSTYAFRVKKDIPYTLTFRAKGKNTTKNNPDSTTTDSAKIMFHLSGSNLSGYDGKSTLTHSGSFGSTITDELNRPVGLQIDDTNKNKTNDYVDFGIVSHTFFPKFKLDQQTNTDTTLQVRIDSGIWVISDLSLRPAQETGFSPDEFSFRVPIPPGQNNQPNNFDFLVEYYDVDGNVAETATFINDVKISGSALIIQGTDNMITGSLFLGSLQGTGIEFHGGSAFIRAIGYQGFKSASAGQGGGFFMWSGSAQPGGETQDNYTGAGLEIHDGNTGVNESYFKFRTIDPDNSNNSTFDIKTSTFFLGQENSNFVSGANGNIEISSSNFHLTRQGNITASNFQMNSGVIRDTVQILGAVSANSILTPASIGGSPATVANASSSIDSQGFAKFVSASIGGWDITSTAISDLNPSGKGIEIKSDPSFPIITLKEDSNDKIELFHNTSNNYGIKGTTDGTVSFQLGSTNKIAGWTFNNESFTGGKMIISQDGTIRSSDFVRNKAGSGFKLTAEDGGFLEVENANIRGTLKTTVFEKETVNAVGGQLYIANSTVLTGSNIAPGGIHTSTQTTMSVENVSGFVQNEILKIKKVSQTGFGTEYVLVNSSSRNDPSSDVDLSGNIMVTRGFGDGTTGDSGSLGDSPGSSQSYSGSQVIVSTGKPPNTGYMRLNANPNDKTTPYMDIVERTGSGIYDVQLKTRLGDLSGVAGTRNVPSGFEGFGLMSEVAFLSGSQIKLEAPTFLLGDRNSNFISGSNGNLSLTSQTFNLNTTSTKIDSSNGGTFALGPTVPTNLTSSGIFLTGSGEFNFQQSSSFIRGDSDGIEVSFPNFGVTKTGILTATDGNFNGRIEAESGFFGSDSTNGWEIDGNKIKSNVADASLTGSIEIDATPTSPNISLTSGSFVAEIVPRFSTSSEILSAGGKTYIGGTFTSGSNSNGVSHTSAVSNGNSSTAKNLFTAYSNLTTSTFGTSVPTQSTGSNGFNYRSTVAGSTRVQIATPNINASPASAELFGSFTVTATLKLFVNNSEVTAGRKAISTTISPSEFVTGATVVKTVNFSHTHTHTLGGNHNLHWKLENVQVTNNNLREYVITGGGAGTSEIAANITNFQAFFTDAKHIVSNKKTELAPAGFQAVKLTSTTLDSSENFYVRIAAEESKTFDILSSKVQLTGSLHVKANATTNTGFIKVPNGVAGAPTYRFSTNNTDGFYYPATSKIGVAIGSSQKFQFDGSANVFRSVGDIEGFSTSLSDIKFKKNVTPLSQSLDKVKSLKGVEFDWKDSYKDRGHDIGFIAQDVEKVKGLEPLVKESYSLAADDDNVKVVYYDKVIPLLVEAIKEQQSQIDELKKKLEES